MARFTNDYLSFLRALARNNNREWFHARKDRFERSVKTPFAEFVGEIIHRIGAIDARVNIEPDEAMFRIHRDIRFSRDKTPYKTFMSAVVSPGGRKDLRTPGIYFQFGASGVVLAGGMYRPDKQGLHRIREAIRDRGGELESILKTKTFRTLLGEMVGDRNKIVPREFRDAQERFPMIANKQFYYWKEYPANTVLRDDLAPFLVRHYRAGKKFGDWLSEAARP